MAAGGGGGGGGGGSGTGQALTGSWRWVVRSGAVSANIVVASDLDDLPDGFKSKSDLLAKCAIRCLRQQEGCIVGMRDHKAGSWQMRHLHS